MMKIYKEKRNLMLEYIPDDGVRWIRERFEADLPIALKNIFHLSCQNVFHSKEIGEDDSSIIFVIGSLQKRYFKIDEKILDISHSVYIHSEVNITVKTFVAANNISIFKRIDRLVASDIYIGGDKDNAIPTTVFVNMLRKFPTQHELELYSNARITSIVKEYIETTKDVENQFEKYRARKADKSPKTKDVSHGALATKYSEFEFDKYSEILEVLRTMLAAVDSYDEKQWQMKILDIILLLYPKYIKVFSEVRVKDVYNDKWRRIDYLLVDSNGNTDIIEIKKPFEDCIVSMRQYRDNHVPMKELSGTVMQIEKYVYYLNKWGRQGEDSLTKEYARELPVGFKIKITNPSGVIIMGREEGLSPQQKDDFEIIKRKYRNILDIITYDDLLRRLEAVLKKFENAQPASSV